MTSYKRAGMYFTDKPYLVSFIKHHPTASHYVFGSHVLASSYPRHQNGISKHTTVQWSCYISWSRPKLLVNKIEVSPIGVMVFRCLPHNARNVKRWCTIDPLYPELLKATCHAIPPYHNLNRSKHKN